MPGQVGHENPVKSFVGISIVSSCLHCQALCYSIRMPQVPKHELKPLDLGEESIGQRIAGLRKGRGLSQADLAERIGISRQLVASYEVGRVRLYDEMVARFSLALGVSADEILGLDHEAGGKDQPSLRLTRRLRELENLSEQKKKKILSTLDDLIRANS